ncbi:UNVERIFIED_CONTAM: hypothetical protein HDU68_008576 [Siphonaria sp. JEL0065]|nr:hypothetical protein HDU68_008576 [Siphonaria sp. JEL0065]
MVAKEQKPANQDKVQVDEELVAVVVADSFNKRFLPLTEDKPRCLLPLANVPLIEYTLEFLATAGVEQIYVVCCSHADQIKAYLKTSRWGKSTFPKVTTVVSQQLASTGDALRDLDAKQLLKSDFILVSGDVVANMDLTKALEEHRARRAIDKNGIMTMVVKAASPTHRTRSKGEEGIYVLNAVTQECVQYRSLFPTKQKLKLDLELFKAHSELQVRNDLIDCQIDICSVDVPALFTENFDYQDIRKHFVRGILESDILGKQIHCHIISDTYAARVRSTQMYDSISKDIMARWTYPMVPDTNILGTTYKHHNPYIYKENGVILQFTTRLTRHVVVGDKTSVGEKSEISNSVVGRNCKIGKNVKINGSYIWDNVVIGDNVVIERSILADGVVVLNGVTIEKGSILSYGVQVGPDFTLREFSRLSMNRGRSADESDEESDSDSEEEDMYNVQDVGEEGKGYEKRDEVDEDEDDEEEHKAILDVCSLARDIQLHDIDDFADDDSDEEDDLSEFDALELSHRELVSTIERAFEENHSIDNIVLELNTFKFAENLDFHDIRLTAVPTVLSLVTDAKTLQSTMKRWGGLLSHYANDTEDQLDLLLILEEHCKEMEEHAKLFVKILQMFYQFDICEEEAFLAWFKKSSGKIRDSAKPFITWLQEADEESSD